MVSQSVPDTPLKHHVLHLLTLTNVVGAQQATVTTLFSAGVTLFVQNLSHGDCHWKCLYSKE